MNPKITPDHLGRGAAVYVRQSTMGQVAGNTESRRRQYALVDAARAAGFASIAVIDDDLGRSGSGLTERPGFQKLVAAVCAGEIGAVFCLEASRLARNGRDWHHLIDLCALAGALVVDPDGVYDPRLVNDRLLLGLKGTMSEYELSLLRQRGLAARDSKAQRGELRFTLPPGYCWSEAGRIEMDPDERVGDVIRLLFAKFRELGSARQVFLWARAEGLQLPVVVRNLAACRLQWQAPAYHTVLQVLQNPIYAGAYAFGRTSQRTKAVDGRARTTSGHSKPMASWNVLRRDNHAGYISWAQFEENQKMVLENAHMQRRASRKSARGGRALLTGLVRCARCGRMMRVFYGMRSGHAHRYQCRGMTPTSGPGSASASAACGSTVPLRPRSWRRCRTARSRRRFSPPTGSSRPPGTSARRWRASSRRRATRPAWQHGATTWSTPPSGTSRVSWRRAGTRPSSVSPGSSAAWPSWSPPRPHVRGSTGRP
jgi:DNA invertase Pin-like site-specific DNA recombinase